MNGLRPASSTWRKPVLVPLYALIASLLLTLGVGRFAGEAPAQPPPNPVAPAPSAPPPPVAPSTSPPAAATDVSPSPAADAAFVAAEDGRPEFTVRIPDGVADPIGSYQWKVMVRSKDPNTQPGFADLGSPGDGKPNTVQRTERPLVDRLLCVVVPDKWAVSVPASVPDVTPGPEKSPTTACQGGWADARSVPKTITFTARPL